MIIIRSPENVAAAELRGAGREDAPDALHVDEATHGLDPPYQEGIRNRTEPAEPNRTEPFNSGTGCNRTRKRTGPSHYASKKSRPNSIEPGNVIVRTEPNRTEPMNCRKVRSQNKSNRIGSFLPYSPEVHVTHNWHEVVIRGC